jgi:flagellar biosynthesis protein FlhB
VSGADASEEKTEQPSAKKLRDVRKKGQVAKSTDLSGALSLLAGMLTVIAMLPWTAARLAQLFLAVERSIVALDTGSAKAVLIEGLKLVGLVSCVPLVVSAVVFTASLALQAGPVFSIDPSMPKLTNLNPVSGLKRLFSAKSVVQFVQMAIKIAIIASAVYLVLMQVAPDAIRVIHGDVGAALVVARAAVMNLLVWCGALFVLLGFADLAFQRWQFVRDNRMSKTEVKRELKEDEGDAHLRAERKRTANEPGLEDQLRYMRIASLVIEHGDGRLIAIVYRPRTHHLPLYVLRAKGESTQQVRNAATANRVATVRDDALADRLFPSAQPGSPIPPACAERVKHHLVRARR